MANLDFIIFLIILILVLFFLYKSERNKNLELNSKYKSKTTRHGQDIEQFVPFMKGFPVKPSEAKFLGQPIDYICFDEEKEEIIFVEVKTGKARLTHRQKWIKKAIEKRRVYWNEVRI